ncbi:MAG: 4Fe-4S binding protein, partial [Rhodocyclaceae bacterium]
MSCAVPAAPPTRLAAFGRWMQRNRKLVLGLQWVTLFAYLFLVAVPAFLPLPDTQAHIWDNLTRFAQFVFWGIWWPFVLVSMMLMGRAWCGVLCPEGFVTEQVSRVGLGRPVPRWIKWGGWPFVAFLGTTVYGQLVSVYEYPKAVLLVLGGSTVAAIAIGLVYGRNKRVWCRHLCPVNGVFGLLSRLAPVHFRTDRDRWDKAAPARVIPVNCAPLVDIRRMETSAGCHMCGRCAGHRDAVELAGRAPGSEVARLNADDASPWEVRLLVYGLIGTAIGAFQWSASPWFVQAKMAAAEWLIERDSYTLLGDNAPWWLLTHYPEASDVFTWLDGLMILAYIGVAALLIGG